MSQSDTVRRGMRSITVELLLLSYYFLLCKKLQSLSVILYKFTAFYLLKKYPDPFLVNIYNSAVGCFIIKVNLFYSLIFDSL